MCLLKSKFLIFSCKKISKQTVSFYWPKDICNHVFSDVDNIVERVANIMTAEDEQSLTKTWRSQFEEYVVNHVCIACPFCRVSGAFFFIAFKR